MLFNADASAHAVLLKLEKFQKFTKMCRKHDSRVEVSFEILSKFGLFSKTYIYSERGSFAAFFYVKNSISIFLQKIDFSKGGGALQCFFFKINSIQLMNI